ncbi:family 16 glycosylhydrolase [Photobacterium indicum]|uniref:family 16 glycosylhydrolase n=1 Tax=Photobacterium indicum TaxID=81447 RepID=UPI001FEC7947|nr:family 16 glycosylhydrolase [Photobacterium indicum]
MNYWTNDDNYTNDHARIIFLDFDASEDFHRYGIKWTKHAIQWFIDGKLVFKVKNTSSDPIPKSSDSPLRIMANIWATDSEISGWAGEFEQSSVPITAEYRNIRYIKGGRCNLKG